jgi:general secretion pathway protein G
MRRQKGFTLIELLIVVAIIGIIAAIAIPNLLNAINRGRQKRTMADIRSIATAVEAYLVDMNRYPAVAAGAMSTLASYLEPTYLRRIPALDGWGTPYQWSGDINSGMVYTIWSPGRDKTTESGISGPGGTTSDFNADIVFSGGSFSQWPDGVQTGQ